MFKILCFVLQETLFVLCLFKILLHDESKRFKTLHSKRKTNLEHEKEGKRMKLIMKEEKLILLMCVY